MRITLRLDKDLLERARAEAARRKTTLASLIEQGLELVLQPSIKESSREAPALPVSRAGGGTLPGVDLDNSALLLDRMDGIG
jgi:hypothetical protein